jgi:hypothetical protein
VADLNLTTSSAGIRPRSFHLDALRLGPLADFGGVQAARRRPAPCPARTPRSTTDPPGSLYITRHRIPQRLGMLRIQVDLILRAIQAEANGPFSVTTVNVIDVQGLYPLSHACPDSLSLVFGAPA